MNKQEFKQLRNNPQKKLDILLNLPSFWDYLGEARFRGEITNFQLHAIIDLDPTPEYDFKYLYNKDSGELFEDSNI